MTIDRDATIAEIVLLHSECAQVFCQHRIDFCCRGNRSLTSVCAQQELDIEVVVADLERAIAARGEGEPDPRSLSDAELVLHIVSRHHAYAYEALRFLEPLAAKVARVHGAHHPKLADVRDTFRELAEMLEPHLREEEVLLFPALLGSVDVDVASELASMQEDHLAVGTVLARLRSEADDFVPPDDACGSYRTLFRELAALEMDTLRHIHLENHVLAPRFSKALLQRSDRRPLSQENAT